MTLIMHIAQDSAQELGKTCFVSLSSQNALAVIVEFLSKCCRTLRLLHVLRNDAVEEVAVGDGLAKVRVERWARFGKAKALIRRSENLLFRLFGPVCFATASA